MSTRVAIVPPEGVDHVLLHAENIAENLRKYQSALIETPSSYRYAYQLVHQTTVTAVTINKDLL